MKKIVALYFGLLAVVACLALGPGPAARAGEVSASPVALEGTWTPTIAGVATAGTASYTLQIGRYWRTGTRVHVLADLTYTGGNGTGQGSIAGLPFASRNVASSDAVCSIMVSNYTFGAVQLSAAIAANSSVITFWGFASAGAIGAVAYDAAASVWVSCVYEATPL